MLLANSDLGLLPKGKGYIREKVREEISRLLFLEERLKQNNEFVSWWI
jgi:hypothetical protein